MNQRLDSASAASALNPALASNPNAGSSSRRTEQGIPNASFSDMLRQHQGDTPAPSTMTTDMAARQEAKLAQTPPPHADQSAARLAERQAIERASDARRMQAMQQANHDAASQTERQAESRRQAEKPHEHEKTKKPEGESSEDKQAAKTREGRRFQHHLHGDRSRASAGKKAEDGELKPGLKAHAKSLDETEAAASANALPGQASAQPPLDPAAAAREAALARAHGAQAGHANDRLDAQAAEGKDLAGSSTDRLGGHGKNALDLTPGAKLAEQAKADAAGKAVEGQASSGDTARVGQGGSPADASFAATLKALGADHKQPGGQDSSNPSHPGSHAPGENAAAKLDGIAGTGHAAAAAGLHGAHRAPEAAPAPTQVALATPTTSPDFAQALGLSISKLATEGVHQAELHLNPAETGPIAVQIAIDGTQAQIDFQAANAHTRDAIFAGMPELAAALNAQGLTLTGGGVTEHGRGSQGQGADDAGRDSSPRQGAIAGMGGDELPAAAPIRARMPRGAVDVYA